MTAQLGPSTAVIAAAPAMPATRDTRGRFDTRSSAALAHTHVTLLGVLDTAAIDAIDDAIEAAERQGHTLTFGLDEVTMVTPDASFALLAESDVPRER